MALVADEASGCLGASTSSASGKISGVTGFEQLETSSKNIRLERRATWDQPSLRGGPWCLAPPMRMVFHLQTPKGVAKSPFASTPLAWLTMQPVL